MTVDTSVFTPGQQVLWAAYQAQVKAWPVPAEPATYLGSMFDYHGLAHDLYYTDAGQFMNVSPTGPHINTPALSHAEPLGEPIREAWERARRLGFVTLVDPHVTQF